VGTTLSEPRRNVRDRLMKILLLRYVVVVADSGSITAATRQLSLRASTFSRSVFALEEGPISTRIALANNHFWPMSRRDSASPSRGKVRREPVSPALGLFPLQRKTPPSIWYLLGFHKVRPLLLDPSLPLCATRLVYSARVDFVADFFSLANARSVAINRTSMGSINFATSTGF